ncbi:IMP cyclohydrolase [Candidatus Pseudoscillospira sp. SGI.172]|uniref:IMP cyclohydrolase n=1 Tax=Candidatus Pseudoscillospira sp. SGI.172 TaxID=3420582 RepID=UPI0009BA6A5D|nr:IMP cyclohydrolase [Pseudoflavonifractor sp.]MDY3020529.1 IMP cyclohydrolase [Oscillospiraceae bacterium]
MEQLTELLSGNPYPGRGIALGRSADGKRAVMVYFIMGRSENSRNRIFEETADGIRTRAFDESRMTDPSLIIYHPVRVVEGTTIVTNGDQTDTVADAFRAGQSFVRALRTRAFEPDGPNWTPRISGVVRPDGGYTLSILKSADGDSACCQRFFFEYDTPIAGSGHFISTYETDGDPLPSFRGEPRRVSFGDESAEELAQKVWNALDEGNKVSLFVRTVELTTGKTDTAIVNKHA